MDSVSGEDAPGTGPLGIAIKPPLRIAVADDEPIMREYFAQVLPTLGHQVVAVAASGTELVERVRQERPDLVITDIKMPDLDGIDAAIAIGKEGPTPVILVSGYDDQELLERARHGQVAAYLMKPVKQADLAPAIAIAIHSFEQFQALNKETAELRQALEDRKIIERAKGIVMKRAHLDEKGAFLRLQRVAMDRRLKLIDVAHMVLLVAELFVEEGWLKA